MATNPFTKPTGTYDVTTGTYTPPSGLQQSRSLDKVPKGTKVIFGGGGGGSYTDTKATEYAPYPSPPTVPSTLEKVEKDARERERIDRELKLEQERIAKLNLEERKRNLALVEARRKASDEREKYFSTDLQLKQASDEAVVYNKEVDKYVNANLGNIGFQTTAKGIEGKPFQRSYTQTIYMPESPNIKSTIVEQAEDRGFNKILAQEYAKPFIKKTKEKISELRLPVVETASKGILGYTKSNLFEPLTKSVMKFVEPKAKGISIATVSGVKKSSAFVLDAITTIEEKRLETKEKRELEKQSAIDKRKIDSEKIKPDFKFRIASEYKTKEGKTVTQFEKDINISELGRGIRSTTKKFKEKTFDVIKEDISTKIKYDVPFFKFRVASEYKTKEGATVTQWEKDIKIKVPKAYTRPLYVGTPIGEFKAPIPSSKELALTIFFSPYMLTSQQALARDIKLGTLKPVQETTFKTEVRFIKGEPVGFTKSKTKVGGLVIKGKAKDRFIFVETPEGKNIVKSEGDLITGLKRGKQVYGKLYSTGGLSQKIGVRTRVQDLLILKEGKYVPSGIKVKKIVGTRVYSVSRTMERAEAVGRFKGNKLIKVLERELKPKLSQGDMLVISKKLPKKFKMLKGYNIKVTRLGQDTVYKIRGTTSPSLEKNIYQYKNIKGTIRIKAPPKDYISVNIGGKKIRLSVDKSFNSKSFKTPKSDISSFGKGFGGELETKLTSKKVMKQLSRTVSPSVSKAESLGRKVLVPKARMQSKKIAKQIKFVNIGRSLSAGLDNKDIQKDFSFSGVYNPSVSIDKSREQEKFIFRPKMKERTKQVEEVTNKDFISPREDVTPRYKYIDRLLPITPLEPKLKEPRKGFPFPKIEPPYEKGFRFPRFDFDSERRKSKSKKKTKYKTRESFAISEGFISGVLGRTRKIKFKKLKSYIPKYSSPFTLRERPILIK